MRSIEIEVDLDKNTTVRYEYTACPPGDWGGHEVAIETVLDNIQTKVLLRTKDPTKVLEFARTLVEAVEAHLSDTD